ncbi:hypothetical protein Tco_0984119 [Tanacetum coccineum]
MLCYKVFHSHWNVKLLGKFLLDHPLSYALTATADVPAVYLQQFWKIVRKVPDTKDIIRFKLNSQEITYIVDIFRDTLKLPVETLENLFVVPATMEIIESFMYTVGYQGVVDKVSAFYTKFLAQPWQTMFKYPSIPQRQDEYSHSIKDDIPLVSVYTTWNVTVQGMLILDAFLTNRATNDYKEYKTVFFEFPSDKRNKAHLQFHLLVMTERDEIVEATLLSLTLHKTTLAAKEQEKVAKVREKLVEEEIEKMVEGKEDEESYDSTSANSMLNDDVDDSGTKIEPRSHKKNQEVVNDDDNVNVIEKKDDEKNDEDVEKMDDVAKDGNNGTTSSMETRNEQMQTPIPTPTRSPRKDLSSDKTFSEELTAHVSSKTATTSKHKSKKGNIREVLDHCNNVVPEMPFTKTNEMIKEEMPHLVNLTVLKDREVDPINVPELISKEFANHGPKMIEELFRKHMQNTTLNLYPTTSSSTAEISTADLQQQLYLNMKSKLQDQIADPELWEILKAKFKKQ